MEENSMCRNNDAEARIRQAEMRAEKAEAELRAVYESRSWRMTAPYRAAGDMAQKAWNGLKSLGKLCLGKGILFVRARPFLKKCILRLMRFFPKSSLRLREFILTRGSFDFSEKFDGDGFLEQMKNQSFQISAASESLSVDEVLRRIRAELASEAGEEK